jgi:hypothetical protein
MLTNILVIIPVLDEAETIAGVIRGLQELGLANICVVDNGSRDRTAEMAAQAGAKVISAPRRGYGQACWSGLQTAEAAQAEWILFCDGDGSDDLSQLPELLALRAEYDFILGNRRGTARGRSQLTPVQNFGNGLATWLIRLGWGYSYQDLGPLRLIRKTAIDRLEMGDRGFGWTVEMQAKAAGNRLQICEIPVNYLPRQGGQSKIAGTLKGSVKAGQVILTTLAQLYGKKIRAKTVHLLHSVTVQRGLLWLSPLLLAMGSVWALPHGDFLHDPNAVPLFWRAMGLMNVGFVLAWGLQKVPGGWFWMGAIAPRLILLAMHPGDDIWRYLWEGHIQNHGFNPYLTAPSADELAPLRLDSLRLDEWSQINHPDHAAIYPPIALLGFRLLALISPSVLLFKLSFTLADLGICKLLSRRFGYAASLLYAWNPLVMYSFAGGGHYDSWFLLPLVMAWLGWRQEEWGAWKSAFWVGMSIATKWMSLPVLMFLVWQKRRWPVGLILASLMPLGLAMLPFCQARSCGALTPLGSEFVTEGRSAALIGPLTESGWLSRLLPEWLHNNWLYALPLGAILLWNIARLESHRSENVSSERSYLERSEEIRAGMGQFTERYFVTLMLLSPIVHAWYFTWLVPFSVASRNWGTRLVSLSAFVYFALPHQLAMGLSDWTLSSAQRFCLWGPFVVGLAISAGRQARQA